jgi:hypothetical protein
MSPLPRAAALTGRTGDDTEDMIVARPDGLFAADSLYEEEIDLLAPLVGDITAGTSGTDSGQGCNCDTVE